LHSYGNNGILPARLSAAGKDNDPRNSQAEQRACT
jgi:hypothetical protein